MFSNFTKMSLEQSSLQGYFGPTLSNDCSELCTGKSVEAILAAQSSNVCPSLSSGNCLAYNSLLVLCWFVCNFSLHMHSQVLSKDSDLWESFSSLLSASQNSALQIPAPSASGNGDLCLLNQARSLNSIWVYFPVTWKLPPGRKLEQSTFSVIDLYLSPVLFSQFLEIVVLYYILSSFLVVCGRQLSPVLAIPSCSGVELWVILERK